MEEHQPKRTPAEGIQWCWQRGVCPAPLPWSRTSHGMRLPQALGSPSASLPSCSHHFSIQAIFQPISRSHGGHGAKLHPRVPLIPCPAAAQLSGDTDTKAINVILMPLSHRRPQPPRGSAPPGPLPVQWRMCQHLCSTFQAVPVPCPRPGCGSPGSPSPGGPEQLMAVLGVFLVALNNAAALPERSLAVITGPVCVAGDLCRGDKAEQGTIPALGRVMVNRGQPALVWIVPWLEKREPDAVPVNQSLHRRQRKAGSVCSACGIHRAPEP